jgi:hypothetical protein
VLAAKVVRAATSTWIAHRTEQGPAGTILAWTDEGLTPEPVDEREAVDWMREVVNAGLRVYHPRVMLVADAEGLDYTVGEFEGGVTFFEALCAQLANAIAENAPLHRCENETCGTWFSRQVGRADAGQYRTKGVKFCSKSCAKAEMERRYRRTPKGKATAARQRQKAKAAKEAAAAS